MFFHGEEKTDCETADQQICDVSLSLRVARVSVVKTFMNNPAKPESPVRRNSTGPLLALRAGVKPVKHSSE